MAEIVAAVNETRCDSKGDGKRRPPWYRLRREAKRQRGAWPLFGVVAVVLASAWVQEDASAGSRHDDRFNQRVTVRTRPAIPGEAFGGLATGAETQWKVRVRMNGGGGGQERYYTTQVSDADCNLPELLAGAIEFGLPLCLRPTDLRLPLLDVAVFPKRSIPPYQDSLSRIGNKVDDIRSRQDVESAVAQLAEAKREQTPLLDPTPAAYEATVELMENAITRRSTRRLLVQNLLRLSGAVVQSNVQAPGGRPASLIEIPDGSRAGLTRVGHEGDIRDYDLTDAAKTELQLYFNPDTFDILAWRKLLVSTTLPELQPYVASSAPGPATLSTTVYRPIKVVHVPRLVAYRVPCRKLEDPRPGARICIELGQPGGRSVSLR